MASVKKESNNQFILDAVKEFMKSKSEVSVKQNKYKPQKRRKVVDEIDENDRNNDDPQISGEFKQNVLNNMNRHLDSSQKVNNSFKKNITEITLGLEDDYAVLSTNTKELQEVTSSSINCLYQATSSIKNRITNLKNLAQEFIKECDELDKEHKYEINQLDGHLDNEMKIVKEKLISASKKKYLEMLQKTFSEAEASMENDF